MVLMVSTGANAVNIAGIGLTSVETVRVADSTTGGNTTINLAGQTGIDDLESFGSAQTGNINFSNVAAIADLSLSNTSGGGSTTVTYTAAAVAGTADVQNVNLSTAAQTGDVTIAGVETIAITTSANSSVALAASSASTVTVNGGANTTSVDLDAAVNTALTSVNASASTGATTITIDADLAGDGMTVTGGSGNDIIDSSAGVLAKTDTIDGGDGTDTLRVQATADTTSATIAVAKATISNMEVLELEADDDAGVGSAGDFTVDMDLIDGVSSIVLDSNDTEFASVFNLDDLSAAQAAAISIQGVTGTTNGSTVNLDLKTGTGTADSATVTAAVKTGNVITIGDDNANIESLTVAMNGGVDSSLTIDTGDFAGTVANPGTITVTGGTAGKAMTVTATANGVVADTVDMSTVASNITFTAGANVNQKVTAGTGDDTFTMGGNLSGTDNFIGGDGADKMVLVQAASVAASVTMSGIETLEVQNGATASVNFNGVTGLTTIDIDADASHDADTFTAANLTGVTGVTYTSDAATGGADNDFAALTVTNGYAGTADAITMTLNSATGNIDGAGMFTAQGVETATIAMSGDEAITVAGFTSTSLTGVTVTDSSAVVTKSVNLGDIIGSAANTSITSFDSTGANVALSVDLLDVGNNATVTTGSGADDIDLGTSAGIGIYVTSGAGNDTVLGSEQADTVVLGAGDDTYVGTDKGNDVIDAGAGADTVNVDDTGTKTITLGAGVDTLAFGVTAAGAAENNITDFASTDKITIDWSSATFSTLHVGNGAARTDVADLARVESVTNTGETMALATANVFVMATGVAGGGDSLANPTTEIKENGGGTFTNGDELLIVVENTTSNKIELGILTIVGGDGFNGGDDTFEDLATFDITASLTATQVANAIEFIT
jgi:hypothetical protein